jgi:hypothetical protein
MQKNDTAARIQAFDHANGGGVGCYKEKGAYHLYLLQTQAPIARLTPTGTGDEVRLAYWSHRRKWEDIDDMGGCVLPLDQALSHIADNSLFWTWT